MVYSGINLGNVKVSNRSSILKLLNDCGAMSRKDIAQSLGLTPATVTLICTELLDAGLLEEKGEMEEEKRAGRRKILIDINYEYRLVLSICIEAARTFIAICDLKGRPRAKLESATDGAAAPEEFLRQTADKAKSLMWEMNIGKDEILGVGVSIPGIISRGTGVSHHAYRIWNEPVNVGECLSRCLDLPVIVENNVKAFAEGELIYGCGKEQENLLFIKWGPGVGSAIIINGRIYDSRNSKTAEIGHYIVEKDGKLCRCGRRGCLETKVALHAVADRVREACTRESMPVLYAKVNGDVSRIEARNISSWFDTADRGLRSVTDEIIDQLAQVAVNTVTMLAPDRVIVYGEMFDLPDMVGRFTRACAHYDPSYGEGCILKSDLGEKIGYIGPVAVVVREMFLMSGYGEE